MAARSDDERLIMDMFSYMRPSGSDTEQEFVDRYLTPLGFERDKHHNLVLMVGEGPPTILWSSHMDTVHRREGRQTLHFDGATLALSKSAKRRGSNCLGADDTAGIWLMTEMAKAGIPGLYVIHHAEEVGCIGSSDLSRDHGGLLDGIQAAVAFDRAGTSEIITHQTSMRTCSDAFAWSVSSALNDALLEPSPNGVYTDTNEYAGIIPECTNIAVGYYRQHTDREYQDVVYLIALRDKLLAANWDNLVIERDPSVIEYDSSYGYGGRSGWHTWDDLDEPFERTSYGSSKYDGLKGYVRAYPELATQILEAFGISESDFKATIVDFYGAAA